MKLQLKLTALLAACLFTGGKIYAQSTDPSSVKLFSPNSSFRTWSIGVTAGALSNNTIFHGKEDWGNQAFDLGYGGFIRKQFSHSFGLQSSFVLGKLHGSQNSIAGATPLRYQTTINYSSDLTAVITLANISWGLKQTVIQPYLTAGAGYVAYHANTYDAAGAKASYVYENTNDANLTGVYIPVGLGFKVNLTPGINLDLGYQVNFVNNDHIDANTTGSTNDKFSYSHIGLEFALGSSSKPQLATHNPVASMREEYTANEINLQNQINAEKAKNDALRKDLTAAVNGLNATNANMAKFTVDSDGDGVPDFFDKCPNTAKGVKVDGAGCPLPESKTVIITEADKKVVKDAIQNLEFDLGKATLRPTSYPSLDGVANLLINKNFSLKLAGHTDSTGPDELNMKLSKDRAEAIKAYLVSKGANASRIEATGYGETQPIATNTTPAGRQQNRRVEFTLF